MLIQNKHKMPAEEPWDHKGPLILLISDSLPVFLLPPSFHLPFDSCSFCLVISATQNLWQTVPKTSCATCLKPV